MALLIGSKAPTIKGMDQNGDLVHLKDFKGQKIALYFYPKDDTPGCTAQACNLRDNMDLLFAKGIVVIGVSIDAINKHKKFEEKYDLPFTLIADEDKKIVNDYEVWGEKKLYGRTYMGTNRFTFLINEKGKIDAIITKVDTKNHAQQIIDCWAVSN